MPVPKILFFDAVGTLFGVRGTVGEIYGQFVQALGLRVDIQHLNAAFSQSFKAAPRAAFAQANPQDLSRLEYEWWRRVAYNSFELVGLLPQIPNFDLFFQPLFAYFETADPWMLYPETRDVLGQLKDTGFELGIISNFDSRLYRVLKALDLDHWFQSITLSTQVGVAKPDSAIFATALAMHRYEPAQAWHIGDSWAEDYEGAVAAGLQGIWLNRDPLSLGGTEQRMNAQGLEISNLTALPMILKEQC